MKKLYLLMTFVALLLIPASYVGAQQKDVKENDFTGIRYSGTSNMTKQVASELGLLTPQNINQSNAKKALPVNPFRGTRAYGYLIFDEVIESVGISTFDVSSPAVITVDFPQTYPACAAAYAEGVYYAYLYEAGFFGSTPISFSKIDLTTGTATEIADYSEMTTLFADMTYDYTSRTMFASASNSATDHKLLKVDLTNGEVTTVATLDRQIITLACSYDGFLYGISATGDFCAIDKADGTVRVIGATGETPKYIQSMDFDHTNNTLYWAACLADDTGWFETINTSTGVSTRIGTLGGNAEVTGLYVPFQVANDGAPNIVTNFTITPGANGALTANLAWTNPSITVNDQALGSLTKIEVYRNGTLANTINNPTIGAAQQWTDNVPASGLIEYKIIPYNSVGEGFNVSKSAFIGKDVPMAVSNLTLTAANSIATLNWTAPTTGINGGWINASSLKYKITRLPDNVVVAENAIGTSYTDNTITSAATYAYKVLAFTTEGNGGEATSNAITIIPGTTDQIVNIGSATKTDKVQPINFYYKSSVAQTIYLASEMTVSGGQINQILYSADNKSGKVITNKPIKVYLANTEKTSLSDGWVPMEDLTLVYEGNVSLQTGSNLINITLTAPYIYGGGNLCIMTERPLDTEYFNNVMFNVTADATHPGRTRVYSSDSKAFDFTQPGTLGNNISDAIVLIKTTGGGILTVTVKEGQTVVEGARVAIESLNFAQTTNAQGMVTFGFVPAGTYTVNVSKFGYMPTEQTGVVVIAGQTAEKTITITKIQQYKVSGTVKDADNNTVEGAKVVITGFNNYEATTNAQGMFEMPAVYKADNYAIKITKTGLQAYNNTFNVVSTDVNLGTISLLDVATPASKVVAEINGTNANITWEAPGNNTIFKYDNGVIAGQLGFQSGTAKGVMGAVHKTPATLVNMSWYTVGTENAGGPHAKVNVYVLGLNAQGKPTSTVLFSQMNVNNTDDQWMTFTFPEPVNAPNGFMIALSYTGFLGLAVDNGATFAPNTNCFSGDYTTGNFTFLEAQSTPMQMNFLIRAEGIITGKESTELAASKNITFGPSDMQASYVRCESFQSDESTFEANGITRSLQGYKVWRLLEGQESTQDTWTLLTTNTITATNYTDATWSTLPKGAYKYAVKAVYSLDNMSSASISNMVAKDMMTNVTVNVNTNTPNNEAANTAKVTMTNIDGKAEHVYMATVNAEGKAVFANVWKGTYNIVIEMSGFTTINENNKDLSTANTFNLGPFTLNEIIIEPYNLEIVRTGNIGERVFNWNVAQGITDDFETHADFTVNSPGEVGWSYIDADAAETYPFQGISFPGSGGAMAYIVFNPSQTTPVMDLVQTPAIAPHSGNKFLASFASQTPPNGDYLISPMLSFSKDFKVKFFAKSYMDDYGLERFKVGYSTTGNAKADFTNWVTAGDYVEAPVAAWTEFEYTIPKAAKYVTIVCVSNDAFVFMLDDVTIGDVSKNTRAFTTYEVYLDGNKAGNAAGNTYTFTGLSNADHVAGVKAVYTSGNSQLVTTNFTVNDNGFKVKGIVTDGDNTPIANLAVKITGDFTYEATTNSTGAFEFPSVLIADNYTINIKAEGMQAYTNTFNVTDADVNLGTIKLHDIVFAPAAVVATATETAATITWKDGSASQIFQYDNGTVDGQLGLNQGATANSLFGAVHNTPAILNSMSWRTNGGEAGGSHPTVNAFVLALNAQGKPTSTVLYSKMNVPNTDDQWTTLTFAEPVTAPNGFMIAVSYAGFIGLAMDNGANFAPNTNCVTFDYTTGEFMFIETLDFSANFLIRAEGLPMGKGREADITASKVTFSHTNKDGQFEFRKCTSSIADESIFNIDNTRSLKGYKVWRLVKGEEATENNWTLLTTNPISTTSYTDNTWSTAITGIYKYAVKAIYSDNVMSNATLSNEVLKNMHTKITMDVKTNAIPNSAEGAIVTLTSSDEVLVYTEEVGANGKAVFEVLKDTYNISISLNGFTTFTLNAQDYSANSSYEVGPLTLLEIIVEPSNLQIEDTDIASSKIFNWNVAENAIMDDFEAHTNFTINSAGETGWSYIDGDGKPTYGFQGITFTNSGSEMAYIVFNPAATTPAMTESPSGLAHSGTKYLASFAADGAANQDFLISPELSFANDFKIKFWAKSYTLQYGNEQFKVGYSTTGKAKADFKNWITTTAVKVPDAWTEYTYTIPAAAKYVTIECVSNDAFFLMIDDVYIGMDPSRAIVNYEVYLDGTKVTSTTDETYTFTNLTEGSHTAGVKSIYASGSSPMASIDFVVGQQVKYTVNIQQAQHGTITVKNGNTVINNGDMVNANTTLTIEAVPDEDYKLDAIKVNGKNITGNQTKVTENTTITASFKLDGIEENQAVALNIYPNPVKDKLFIDGEYNTLEMFNTSGQMIGRYNSESSEYIDVTNLTNGLYIIKAYNNDKVGIYKVIIKK